MKKTGILLIAILLFFGGFSQDEKKFTFGADIMPTYSIISRSTRTELQLGFSVYRKAHQLRIAPVIHIESSESSNNPEFDEKLTGVSVSYYYNLPTKSKVFDLYFRFESTMQFYENEWIGNFYDANENVYKEYENESHEYFFGNTVAYGLTVNLTRKLYFKTDIAAGFYLSNITGAFESEVRPNTNTRIDFRGYDKQGFFGKITGSVGYKF
ncbi:MAG: hypothetical protein ABF242_02595 [Flavobacteriales bacterium]